MGEAPKMPDISDDLLDDIKSAYNALLTALDAAGLPRPPSWT